MSPRQDRDRGREVVVGAPPLEPRAVDTLFCALLTLGVVAWVSTRVTGFTTDSDSYLDVAENLRAGRGLVQSVVDFWLPTMPHPLGMWPPLYPTLVAVVAAFGVPLEPAALFVAGASFVLFGLWFHRLAARLVDRPLALFATVSALTTLGVAVCSAHAWSEATYLALLAAGLAGIARRDTDGRASPSLALAAGACFGAAALTRYAGMPLALAAVAFVAVQHASRRGAHAFAFAFGALLPPLGWIARNLVLFGQPLGPELPAGTAGIGARSVEIAKALRWELLPAPLDATAALATVLSALVALGVVRALVRPGAARAVAGTAVLSLGVLAVATATHAINAPGGRLLAPALPFLGLAAVAGLWPGRLRPGAKSRLAVSVVAALAILSACDLVLWGRNRPERAVASLERRNDRAAIRALVPAGEWPVLSDAGQSLRLATGRPAVQIPPAAYRPRPFVAADLVRWRTSGASIAVVAQRGEADSTLRALGARPDTSAGRFVRLVLPR